MTNIEKESEPHYVEDKDLLESSQIPVEYSFWCFRIVLDKNKMFLNNIIIDEIKNSIEQNHNMFVLAHSVKNLTKYGDQQDLIIMRMYLGPSIEFTNSNELRTVLDDFLDFNLRGIRGIMDTSVQKESIPVFDMHLQQIVNKDRLVIYTDGSNIRDIMRQ